MKKNKVLNIIVRLLKTIARVLVLNIPAVIILLALRMAGQLSWLSAGVALVSFWVISGIIVFYVFKDLDDFMAYLKKLAQGFEPELPKLHWGIFSSMRLAKTFLSVKNLWSNQFLSDSSVLENLPNPMIMVDTTQKIVFANLSAQRLFSKTMLQKRLCFLLQDKRFSDYLKPLLSRQTLSFTLNEWPFQMPSGATLTFQVKMDALPAPTRNGARVVISFFDITPFELFKEQQAAFFANASHELKTPLAIINGCVETLQGAGKDDEQARKQFLPLIAEQSARMTALVQKMLTLSRLQTAVPLSAQNTFSLNDLLQKVADDLNVRAKTLNKKIRLQKQLHLPLMAANREEMYHLFQNLVDNALKYGADDSVVTVSTYFDESEQAWFVVRVHNVGEVIAPENLPKIWDKFYRATTAKEGSGLGLSIVQDLVTKYRGRVAVESSAKKGTTFTVYLPLE